MVNRMFLIGKVRSGEWTREDILLLPALTKTMSRSNLGDEKVYFCFSLHEGTSHWDKSWRTRQESKDRDPCYSQKHYLSWGNSLIVKEVNKKHGRRLCFIILIQTKSTWDSTTHSWIDFSVSLNKQDNPL